MAPISESVMIWEGELVWEDILVLEILSLNCSAC
jgi:predicted RNA-binding protein